jgi:hypothetical protein
MTLVGCIVVEDSPAPGCVKSVGFMTMGGCSGKHVIQDVVLEPQSDCLTITVNNCNGGVLEINNQCEQPVVFGEVVIEPVGGDSLDVRREGDEYHLVSSGGNYANYLPETDEHIVVEGLLGDTPLRLEFVKTGPLCP